MYHKGNGLAVATIRRHGMLWGGVMTKYTLIWQIHPGHTGTKPQMAIAVPSLKYPVIEVHGYLPPPVWDSLTNWSVGHVVGANTTTRSTKSC